MVRRVQRPPSMSPRDAIVRLLMPITLLAVGAFCVDLAVETDEERLDAFVDALIEDDAPASAALRHADPNREPLLFAAGRTRAWFDEGDEIALERTVQRELGDRLAGQREVLQESVRIHGQGDEATVALRLRTHEGTVDARLELRRHGDRWLLRELRVSS